MATNTTTAPAGPWSVENWIAFWNNPSAEVAAKRVPTVVSPDVVGRWPRTTEPLRGTDEYKQRIIDLLTFVPDFRLELMEHATNGEFVFVRWNARGTGPDGPFEAIGCDRIRLSGGVVKENLIMSDAPIFDALLRYVEEGGTAF